MNKEVGNMNIRKNSYSEVEREKKNLAKEGDPGCS
jgi:hypothetical protein